MIDYYAFFVSNLPADPSLITLTKPGTGNSLLH